LTDLTRGELQPESTARGNHNHRYRLVGLLYGLAAITAWGCYFPFAKLILKKLSPIVFLIFRLGIGAMILVTLSVRLRKSFRVKKSDTAGIILAGLVGVVLHQLIQLTGLKHTTATNTGWILTLIPPLTGLLGWIFLKEAVSLKQIAGLVIAMIGLSLFVSRGKPTSLSLVRNYGDVLALTSVATWSVYTVLTKSRLTRYDPLPVSAIHMGLGFAFFFLIGGWRIATEVAFLGTEDWVTIVLIGIVPSGLAYYWWNAALKRMTSVNTSTFLFLEAVVASLAGFLLLGERFTLPMVAAAGFIILGVYITQATRD